VTLYNYKTLDLNELTAGINTLSHNNGLTFQQLTNHFRANFSKFMMSIDNADIEGMRESAEKLDAGKYYGLMACMITGRSWQAIVNGIYRTQRSSSEVSKLSQLKEESTNLLSAQLIL
jgi:hypothetical protein